ncbi:hypothetical protein W911_12635 [Hyphomicrobium nitrativorans NL23]|uniref:C2 domain-containing protein n=1 Tax=Hyphomicrobium nitrativorans NL23 TaxID=1029756 RepID=V5SJJ5_9HYPH|nr:hypothetical protein [Hyphomicrobium nitrativorans]AHB50265.1 hypothetical protein W911_12635 [Hyphomicrobium nitrativorans NL23]
MLRACFERAARVCAAGAGFAAIAWAAAALQPTEAGAQAAKHEITVTVTRFKALDRADELSAGDFFARVTIDGASQQTAVISDKAEVKPDWKLSKEVKPGVHKVKLELIDKDVSVDDPIDINRLPNKRDLDFTVDTRSCKLDGFAQSYKCGATITRAGTERKKAEISFKVDVKKK